MSRSDLNKIFVPKCYKILNLNKSFLFLITRNGESVLTNKRFKFTFVELITYSVFMTVGAVNSAIAWQGSDSEKTAEGQKPFLPLSSIAAISASERKSEIQPLLSRFEEKATIKDFGGGKEYLVDGKKGIGGCWFPESSASFKATISSGKGMVAPVFKVPFFDSKEGSFDGFDSIIDWPATAKLHAALTKEMRLNILPMSATKEYWELMKKYLQDTLNEDSDRYYEIANSGGGIFGQLFGSMKDKNGAYAKTKDPNYRLSGIYRPEYFNKVLSGFGDLAYLVTSNDASAITLYYEFLAQTVLRRLDPESLALNLQKDIRGNLFEVRNASRMYHYGLIDDSRAANSSTMSIIASSAIKINFHSDQSGDNRAEYRKVLETARLATVVDEGLFFLRGAHGAELSISLVEKFRNLNASGIDRERIFCGVYDKSSAQNLIEAADEMSELRGSAVTQANPIVFGLTGPFAQSKRDANVESLKSIFLKVDAVKKSVAVTRSTSETTMYSQMLPDAFRATGFIGYISSKKLK